MQPDLESALVSSPANPVAPLCSPKLSTSLWCFEQVAALNEALLEASIKPARQLPRGCRSWVPPPSTLLAVALLAFSCLHYVAHVTGESHIWTDSSPQGPNSWSWLTVHYDGSMSTPSSRFACF